MLTKKQLEIAETIQTEILWADEHGHCSFTVRDVAKTALAYRDMLKRLEWVLEPKTEYPQTEWESKWFCVVCGGTKYSAHKPDCALAALLKEE
jgi:hypothetical protein